MVLLNWKRRKHPSSQVRESDAGFTLIELLVVVAIIAVLVAILLPALSRAREDAKGINCQANIRQLAMGVLQYTNEENGWLPFYEYSQWGMNVLYNPVKNLKLYVPYPRLVSVPAYPYKALVSTDQQTPWRCPSDAYWAVPVSGKAVYASYFKNLTTENPRLPGNLDADRPRKIDSLLEQLYWGVSLTVGEYYHTTSLSKVWCFVDQPQISAYMASTHHGGCNFAFLDGHVGWYRDRGNTNYLWWQDF